MEMIGKVVVLTCLGTLAAGAQTIVFNGCNSTPNDWLAFKSGAGFNSIAEIQIKASIPTTNTPRDITLILPGSFARNEMLARTSLEKGALSNLNNSKVRLHIKCKKTNGAEVKIEDLEELCYNSCSLVGLDISEAEISSNVTSAKMMFWGCNRLEEVNFGNFNASNITNMQSMFQYCCNLKKLDLSKFNTKHVTDMSLLFMECNKLEDLDITSFNTSNVTTMQSMFNGCHNIKRLDLSNFNTRNVKSMAWMFDKSKNLEKIKLNSFRTHNVKDMCYMFRGCSKLQNLDLSSFSIANTEYYGSMLEGCNNLVVVDEPWRKTYEQKQYIYGHVFSTIHSLMTNNGTELADLI